MLIFLDMEKTGLEADDKICSIGLVADDGESQKTLYSLVNAGKKILPKVSSVNHITKEMLKGKPTLKESEPYRFLVANNTEECTLVGHNIRADLEMLGCEGFVFKGSIVETMRVTKHLVPECELFGLQVLRYELKLYKQEEKLQATLGLQEKLCAHHALADALVVKLLFEYLLEIASEEKMQELSFLNVLMQKLTFGKHEGKYIEDVAINDRNYLEWMLNVVVDLDEDLRYSIEHYLG